MSVSQRTTVKRSRESIRARIYMEVARTCIIFAGHSSYPDEWMARAVLDDAIDRLLRLRACGSRRDREYVDLVVETITDMSRLLRQSADALREREER